MGMVVFILLFQLLSGVATIATSEVFLGYFVGQWNHFSYDVAFPDPETLTVQGCALSCSQYHYFALSYAAYCFCSNTYDPSGPLSQAPTVNCTGDSTENCGGLGDMDIYLTSANDYTCSTPSLPSNTQIVSGCTAADAYNTSCVLACNDGYYQFSGDTSRLCDGVTTVSDSYTLTLVCLAPCSTPSLPSHTHIVSGCTSADAPGSSCVLACDDGSVQTNWDTTKTCDQTVDGVYDLTLSCMGATTAAALTSPYSLGCFEFQNTDSMYSWSTIMSAEVCGIACAGSTYSEINDGQCYCSDLLGQPSDGTCDLSCAGNTDESCGSSGGDFSYYITPAASDTYQVLLGCFVNQWDQFSSTDGYFYSQHLTIEACARYCHDWDYFALSYGQDCYCSNSYNESGPSYDGPLATLYCDADCAGDDTEECGGFGSAMQIYQTSAIDQTCSTPSRPSHTHIVSGCTGADAYGSSCVLACNSGYLQASGDLAQVCDGQNILSGTYTFTLVCFEESATCSTPSLPSHTHIVSGCTSADAPGSSCVLACDDDSVQTNWDTTKTCDQTVVDGVYDLTLTCVGPSSIASLTSPASLGCFLFSSPSDGCYSQSMSAEACAAACTTTYAEIQGDICFCTDDLGQSSSEICDIQCDGNSDEACGSSGLMSWSYYLVPPESSTSSVPIGCYSDSSSFTGTPLEISSLKVEFCATYCSQYSYFSLLYNLTEGYQCYCSNTFDKSGTTSSDCDFVCPGDGTQTCGSDTAMNVYQTSASDYTCSTPSLPSHSHIVSGCTGADAYNATCVLACNSGYFQLSGDTSRLCDGVNTLGGVYALTLVCLANDYTCSTPSLPSNTHIVSGCTGADDYNTACVLACNDGFFELSGDTSRSCDGINTAGGVYTLTLTCLENDYTCSTPSLPSNTQIVSGCTDADAYNTTCVLACNDGYAQGSGDTTQICDGFSSAGGAYTLTLGCMAYVGCFSDGSPPDLNGTFYFDGSAMTIESCASYCSGYNYIGLQSGSECFCGNSYGTYISTNPSPDCSTQCAGSSEICGGSWANSIYDLSSLS